jgi:uncharacterized protein
MRALLTGATGFVGRRLLEALPDVTILSRNPQAARRRLGAARVFGWDPVAEQPPTEAFDGVDVVFHLAGEPVAEGRWTQHKKHLIRESRLAGTRHLVAAMLRAPSPPKTLVSASAVGFYGSRGDEILAETATPGSGFLVDVCRGWEEAAAPAHEAGVRVVHPRIGIVLGRGGGALGKMLLPFKLGAGGPIGDGRQWMPWIHLDDLVGILLFAAEHGDLSGPINAVAPNPVTNRDFARTLGRVLHRPAFLPTPAIALRVLLGEFATVLVASQRVVPAAALAAGYPFRYPELETALRAIVSSTPEPAPRPLASTSAVV